MPNILSQQQIDSYNQDGFTGPFDLLTPDEARTLRDKVEEVEGVMGDQIQKRCKIKAHLPFPFLCDVISHLRLLDMVEDIIGPNILCWGSSFFQKEANDPGFVSWHQDLTYYGLEPPDTLTAWIAISEASLEAGCMKFIPGSHNQGIYEHEEFKGGDNLLSRGQTILGIEEEKRSPFRSRPASFPFTRKTRCMHRNQTGRMTGGSACRSTTSRLMSVRPSFPARRRWCCGGPIPKGTGASIRCRRRTGTRIVLPNSTDLGALSDGPGGTGRSRLS